jgi:hypothetical protein
MIAGCNPTKVTITSTFTLDRTITQTVSATKNDPTYSENEINSENCAPTVTSTTYLDVQVLAMILPSYQIENGDVFNIFLVVSNPSNNGVDTTVPINIIGQNIEFQTTYNLDLYIEPSETKLIEFNEAQLYKGRYAIESGGIIKVLQVG